jgi:hypothetical protein
MRRAKGENYLREGQLKALKSWQIHAVIARTVVWFPAGASRQEIDLRPTVAALLFLDTPTRRIILVALVAAVWTHDRDSR